MGGRLDATNVLDLGVAAITNVQRDHEAYLGNTLTAIGGEKAAIIKPGNLAVTGASRSRPSPDPRPMRRCSACRFAAPGPRQPYRATLRHAGWDGIVVDARTPSRDAGRPARRAARGAPGRERRGRARPARCAGRAPRASAVDEPSIRRGLAAARWPGRLELLDGATHRPRAGAAGRRAQPGRRGGAGASAGRPRAAAADDRVRRDAREEGPRRPARACAARAALRLHAGRRSRRPRTRRARAHLAAGRQARTPTRRPRLPRRCDAPRAIRWWWPARSTWSARFGA